MAVGGLVVRRRPSPSGLIPDRIVVSSASRHRCSTFWLTDQAKQEHSMNKTIRILAMASLLMTGAAATMAASSEGGGVSSKGVTGTELGSPQTNAPATDAALGASTRPIDYPGTVGPDFRSTQPDATSIAVLECRRQQTANSTRRSPTPTLASEPGNARSGVAYHYDTQLFQVRNIPMAAATPSPHWQASPGSSAKASA